MRMYSSQADETARGYWTWGQTVQTASHKTLYHVSVFFAGDILIGFGPSVWHHVSHKMAEGGGELGYNRVGLTSYSIGGGI